MKSEGHGRWLRGGVGIDVVNVHIRAELAECFVKIVHLRQDADRDHDHEDVSAGVDKLVLASEGEFYGNAEGFDGHYADGADGRADGEVDERVLFAVGG